MILPAPMLDTYTRLPNARIFSGIPGKLTPNVNTALVGRAKAKGAEKVSRLTCRPGARGQPARSRRGVTRLGAELPFCYHFFCPKLRQGEEIGAKVLLGWRYGRRLLAYMCDVILDSISSHIRG
jgi:hypothetical protein